MKEVGPPAGNPKMVEVPKMLEMVEDMGGMCLRGDEHVG